MYADELLNDNIYIEIDSRHDEHFEQATSKVHRTFFICITRCRRAEHLEQPGVEFGNKNKSFGKLTILK